MPRSKTHDEIRDAAIEYIKRTHGFYRWMTETRIRAFWTSAGPKAEIPDAIGFKGESTVVIESKVSDADFAADQQKPSRKKPDIGMGSFRYYAVPEYLIEAYQVREPWGLLYVNDAGEVYPVKECGHCLTRDWKSELAISVLAWGELEGDEHRKADTLRKDRGKGGELPDRFVPHVATVVRTRKEVEAKHLVDDVPGLVAWAKSKQKARNAVMRSARAGKIDGVAVQEHPAPARLVRA